MNKRKGCNEAEALLGRTLQAVVTELSPAVQIRFHTAPPAEIEAATWEMRKIGNTSTFKQCTNALERFVTENVRCTAAYPAIMQGLPGKAEDSSAQTEPELKPDSHAITPDLDLNESQMRALKASLSDKLTLVQGPPGTGTHQLQATLYGFGC